MNPTSRVDRGRLLDRALATPSDAEATCSQLLGDPLTSDHDRVSALLALAWILYGAGAMVEANGHLASARAIVDKEESPNNGAVEIARLEAAILSAKGLHGPAENLLQATIRDQLGVSRARLYSTLGQICFARRDFSDALEAVARGLADAETFQDDRAAPALLTNRATALLELGRLDEAEVAYQTALSRGVALDQPAQTAVATHNLGVLFARRGNLSRALELFDQSIASVRHGAGRVGLGHSMLDQSDVLLEAGLFDEALTKATRAQETFADLQSARSSAVAVMQQTRVLAASGQWRAARRTCETALKLAERVEVGTDSQDRLAAQAREMLLTLRLIVSIESGEPDLNAAHDLEPADLLDTSPGLLVDGAMVLLLAGYRETGRELLIHCVNSTPTSAAKRLTNMVALAKLGQIDGKGTEANAAVSAGLELAREYLLPLSTTELRAMVSRRIKQLSTIGLSLDTERKDVTSVIARLEQTRELALVPEPHVSSEELALLSELRALKASSNLGDQDPGSGAKRIELEHRLRTSRRTKPAASRTWPDSLSSGPNPTDALYLYALDQELWMVQTTDIGDGPSPICPLPRIQNTLRSCRLTLEHIAAAGPGLNLEPIVESLRQQLAPLLTALGTRDKTVLVIEPTLEPIPWSLLTPSLVIEIPSLSVASDRVSDWPQTSAAFFAGPGLRYAEQEVQELSRPFADAQVYLGALATAENARAALASCELVHFACHGTFHSDRALHSSLQLADGSMTFYELLNETAPQRVVFSACDVGKAAHSSAAGLASIMLSRGTNELIAASGKANDRSTSMLMRDMYNIASERGSLASGLRVAQRRHADRDPSTALFTVFGA